MTLKIRHYFFLFNAVVIVFGIVFLGYLYFIDGTFNPELNISSLRTTQDTYNRGDLVQMQIDFCKQKDVPLTFTWTLYDDDAPPVTYKPKTVRGVASGCYKGRVTNIEILPRYIAPGKYHFENNISYEINPIKSVDYIIKTNTFNVI